MTASIAAPPLTNPLVIQTTLRETVICIWILSGGSGAPLASRSFLDLLMMLPQSAADQQVVAST